MSYLVLARKYRPQRFSEVVGQPHVVKTLQNALKKGRLAHALLFAGIRGVGKTTVARIVAKALNCEGGVPEEPCNQCSPCREITEGRFLDVIEIDAASNRGIDEVRELRENLKFAPGRGRAKVYIIDEAHMLTREAANALLKSLEEPPSHVYFILATTEPYRLPVTILSRCQRYDFRRLPVSLLVEHLKEVARKEGAEIEDAALTVIAKEAEGSIRDALSLLDQALAYGVRTKEELLQAFGLAERDLVEEFARALVARDTAKVLALAEEAYEKGVDLTYLAENLAEFFRHLLAFKLSPETVREDLSPSEVSALRELSVEVDAEEALLLFQHALRGAENLKRSPYPYLSFQLTLARVCEVGRLSSLREVFRKLTELLSSDSVVPRRVEEEKTEALEQGLSWQRVVEEVKKESPALAAYLSSLPEPELKDGRLVLVVPEGGILEDEDLKERLKGIVYKKTGHELWLETKHEPTDLKSLLLKKRQVKEALEVFGGKVAWIKPQEKE